MNRDEIPQEVKDAKDQMEEAIKNYLNISSNNEGFLVDWLIVSAYHHPSKTVADYSSTSLKIHVSEDQPMYRSMGLVKYADRAIELSMTS